MVIAYHITHHRHSLLLLIFPAGTALGATPRFSATWLSARRASRRSLMVLVWQSSEARSLAVSGPYPKYIYIYAHSTYTHIPYIHTLIHTYTHTYITHITHITHIHTYTHTHIHTYTRTHVHTYTHIHTYTHTYTHTHTYTPFLYIDSINLPSYDILVVLIWAPSTQGTDHESNIGNRHGLRMILMSYPICSMLVNIPYIEHIGICP